ncbi:MAG: EAL domain-containing protein [Actinomycetota bacterium]|nr:EAL domain-containing protein [Actinomycetota bacterium]
MKKFVHGQTRRLTAAARRIVHLVPRGRALPDDVWARRHRGVIVLLWLHAVGITVFGAARGFGLLHTILEGTVIAAAAILAGQINFKRSVRSGIASVGLVTSSAVLVHLSGGYIEFHFHFFVMVIVMALYQDWVPFLLAIGYVVAHHGIVGVLDPTGVYNHEDAIAHPWRWAAIHGVFVVAASCATLMAWRLNEHQSLHDPLTRLGNRVLLRDRVEHALTRRERYGGTIAVLFLDLDGFKSVNDTLGHTGGDNLLAAVAERLLGCVRSIDTVARLGGDEFGILLEDVVDPGEAGKVAERVLEALAAPFAVDTSRVATGASIGIAFSGDGVTVDDLIRNADVAMYETKRSGRGNYVIFEPAMHATVVSRLELETELAHAIGRNELVLHYQPIVNLGTGAITGVEALVRWMHPRRGLLSPAAFIPVAEESGLIVPIGRWVLREACRQTKSWQDSYATPDLTVSVNLSPKQLNQPTLIEETALAIADTELDARCLVLEITESAAIGDIDATIATLNALKQLGVRLAIDDFGTGYSSLNYLRRFPVDILKIDRSFAQEIDGSADALALAEAIVGLGAALRLQTLAEGIEESEHRDRFCAMNCELGQGFYFAKPLERDAVDELLASRGVAAANGTRSPRSASPLLPIISPAAA